MSEGERTPVEQVDARSIAEQLPVLVWATDEHGSRTYFNSAWLQFRGKPLEEVLGMRWSDGVHPDDLERYIEAYTTAIHRRESFELTHRLRRHDGVYRWMLARGRPWHIGDRYVGYLGATTDVTAQVEAEAQLREHRDALRLALAAAGMGTWIWHADTDEVAWDQRMAELLGATADESTTLDAWLRLIHPDDLERVQAVREDAIERRGPYNFEARVQGPDGAIRWIEVRGEVFEDGSGNLGGTRGVAVDISARKRTEGNLERALDRLALLADAGAVLGSSLELTDTVHGLGAIVTADFADSCEIVLRGDDELSRYVTARDDGRAAMREAKPIPDDPEHPIRRVLATGRTEMLRLADSPDDFGPADDPTSTRGLGITAAIIVPIVVRASIRGALAIGWHDEPEDLGELREVATDLASRAGLAIENTRLFEAQRSASIQLQRSMLPDDISVPEGYQVAARYHPGDAGLEVGGDWYDTTVDAEACLYLSVGDVVGKGIDAASTMIRARTTLRMLMLEHNPGKALAALAELPHVTRAGYVTVLAGRIGPDGSARFASAGHLPPLVVSPDGDVTALDVQFGCPLGFVTPRTYVETTHELAPGSRLIAYTDGLVERRGWSIDDGIERLREALAVSHGRSIEEVADFVLAAMLPPRADDDAAFVIVELPG